MLKFLDNRAHQSPSKSPKKYLPQFLYGNSFQCPKQFQTSHTIFHKSTYLNPYLKYQQTRIQKLPSQSLSLVQPKWKNKVDLQSVQEQKIISTNVDKDKQLKDSKYLTSFYQQFGKDKARFRKSKGEFSTFIQKNNKFKALGPLHGDHRDQTRINQAKSSVWLKPNLSILQSTPSSLQRTGFLNLSIRSSISKNSKLLTQKQRIRQNRQQTYNQFRKSLQNRKQNQQSSELFQLPKKGPEHQLNMYQGRKGLARYTHTFLEKINNGNNVVDMDEDQAKKDIRFFDQTVRSKFK